MNEIWAKINLKRWFFPTFPLIKGLIKHVFNKSCNVNLIPITLYFRCLISTDFSWTMTAQPKWTLFALLKHWIIFLNNFGEIAPSRVNIYSWLVKQNALRHMLPVQFTRMEFATLTECSYGIWIGMAGIRVEFAIQRNSTATQTVWEK